MKKEDIFNELSNIDTAMIAEADPSAPIVRRKGRARRVLAIMAACFALLIVSASLWLFVPYSVEQADVLELLEDNEYYDIYLKTYEYYAEKKNTFKNNFEKYIGYKIYMYYFDLHKDERRGGVMMEDSLVDSAGDSQQESRSGTYVEVTDNQVNGIIEPDLFKRTDTHLFYLSLNDGRGIYSYMIDGDKSEQCGFINVFRHAAQEFRPREMYLSEDGDSLYLVATHHSGGTLISEIDVSDPSNMYQKGSIKLDGRYVSSRINDGKLIIAYTQRINIDLSRDYSILTNLIPENIIVTPPFRVGYEVPFSREDIVIPQKMNGEQYLLLLQINLETLEVEDKLALLSFSSGVFTVFDDKILASYSYSERENKVVDTYPTTFYREKTEIAVISYGEGGFELIGSLTLDGYVNDRYAIDLDGDVLRVVTTSEYEVRNNITYDRTREDIACNLWCYDLSKNKMIASVENFAPEDEDIKSVRFDGDTVYICTAKIEVDEDGNAVFFDPVYFFDLSDYKNITSIDTGTIEGYSSSLKPFGDGLLLGIGYGEDYGYFDDTLKVEIYAENGDKVKSVCAYERANIWFATSYHSYFLDGENGYIGIAFTDRERPRGEQGGYMLLYFDGEKIVNIAEKYFDKYGDQNHSRSIVIDGYLYIMYEGDFCVVNLNE